MPPLGLLWGPDICTCQLHKGLGSCLEQHVLLSSIPDEDPGPGDRCEWHCALELWLHDDMECQ